MNSLGRLGEEVARKYLEMKGWQILESNYKSHLGEIDLIVIQPGATPILVFVEVKTRRSYYHGNPAASVDLRKQKRLFQVANSYLEYYQSASEPHCRFDVIEVLCTKSGLRIANHLEGAFTG